ncbi:thioesterase family protein [Roseburia hominis]
MTEAYRHKVQYYETDQMKIVHHSNYIRWFEEARIDYMEQLGMPYAEMEERKIISPVLAVEAEYMRMVHFGDTVSIQTKIKEYNGIKLAISYEVTDEKTGMVHCMGVTKHCFLNEKGRPISLKRAFPDYHEKLMNALTHDRI